jgi:hypothetical protein
MDESKLSGEGQQDHTALVTEPQFHPQNGTQTRISHHPSAIWVFANWEVQEAPPISVCTIVPLQLCL